MEAAFVVNQFPRGPMSIRATRAKDSGLARRASRDLATIEVIVTGSRASYTKNAAVTTTKIGIRTAPE
jgi:hypothetical protein